VNRLHGRLQRLRDLDRDLLPDGDNVVGRAVVSLRPQMKSVGRADERRRDPQPEAGVSSVAATCASSQPTTA